MLFRSGLVIEAARRMPDTMFIVNGEGSSRDQLRASSSELANVVFVDYQPVERLGEVLASAVVHVVPLRTGLGAGRVRSKASSIMAAGRPILASIDADSEVARMVVTAGCGRVVAPDDADAFVAELRQLLASPDQLGEMGRRGRDWVVEHASPAAVGESYATLISGLDPRG